MKIKNLLILLLFIILLAGSFWAGFKFNNKPSVHTNDTILVETTDTFTLVKPIPVIIIKDTTIIDTLLTTDSVPVFIPVQVPLSLYHYKDTAIQAQDSIIIEQNILGYRVMVQNLTARLKTVSTVIIPSPVIKSKRFSIGPFIGVTINNNKIEPTIGLGCNIKLWEF